MPIDAPGPGPQSEQAPTLAERLLEAYAQDLMDRPPVRSLSADETPDPDERRRESLRLAAKATHRICRVLAAAGLEIIRTEAKHAARNRLRTAESCVQAQTAKIADIESRHAELLKAFHSLFDASRDAVISVPGRDMTVGENSLCELLQTMYDACPFVPGSDVSAHLPTGSRLGTDIPEENINSPCQQ